MRSSVLTFSLLLFSIESSSRVIRDFPGLTDHLSKKEADDDQCIPVNFSNGQLGLVNVIAFLDDTWQFSYLQANMLKQLKDRFDHSGMPDILFFAVINNSSGMIEFDDNAEELAWINVAPAEVFEIKTSNDSLGALEDIISRDIFVVRDNDSLRIWNDLNGSRDQVLVINRCGKISYQIIAPWSILHFPYVKAAILSTYKDDPCGPCDSIATVVDFDPFYTTFSQTDKAEEVLNTDEVTETTETKEFDHSDSSSTLQVQSSTPSFEGSGTDAEEVTPNQLPSLKIIMHAPHYHINDDATKKHEYLVLEFIKPNYHGHLDTSDANKYEDVRGRSGTILDSIIFDKDESPGFYGEIADFLREDGDEEIAEDNNDNDATPLMQDELTMREESETKPEAGEETSSKLIAHYSKLLPWIYYVLDN